MWHFVWPEKMVHFVNFTHSPEQTTQWQVIEKKKVEIEIWSREGLLMDTRFHRPLTRPILTLFRCVSLCQIQTKITEIKLVNIYTLGYPSNITNNVGTAARCGYHTPSMFLHELEYYVFFLWFVLKQMTLVFSLLYIFYLLELGFYRKSSSLLFIILYYFPCKFLSMKMK